MFAKIVAGAVLSTGAVLAMTGCADSRPTATVTVTAPPVPATVAPTEAPTMSVATAVAAVRQQGTADLNTWPDGALVRQFNDVCHQFSEGRSFDVVLYGMTTRTAAPFGGTDAGAVISAAVLSTCPEFYSTISNL